MNNITQEFIAYLFNKADCITDSILAKADSCKQDYFSVAFAGAAKNKKHWESILNNTDEGKSELIGYVKRVDEKTAALINGFNAHALELDDGQRFAMIHLGASIISAIKAAADNISISNNAFLTGIIMGYEAACRVAIAMQPSHKNRGYHTAGTCGTIGSAVGVAFALGMDKEQLNVVLTCAAGSAAGMLEIQEQNSEIKPYNVGRAAMDGLTSAYMGYTYFMTPDDMFGGDRGFFRVFADEFYSNKLIEDTDYFEIERIYVKPYASCRHSHSAVEAAIRLHESIDINEIDTVDVLTYKLGVKGHDHNDIHSVAAAKLSTPYAVAAGLIYGRADLSVFEPIDAQIVELAKKVVVSEDTALTAESPKMRIAIVKVTMNDGRLLESRVDYAKGDPENPMTDEELAEKRRLLESYASKLNN